MVDVTIYKMDEEGNLHTMCISCEECVSCGDCECEEEVEEKCPCGCEEPVVVEKETALPADVVKDIQLMLEVISMNVVKDSYGEDIYAGWMKKYSM